ncbi:MAG: aspartate/glutamate racemase family protein [Desulfobacterales bacterium]|nr:aspartate/glutamate racemase family protein [Desulfobacterales bacterium]
MDPFIGILMLDTRFPRIPGDIGNPETFDFPVKKKLVQGATVEKVVLEADPQLLAPFIQAGLELAEAGAVALTTSCGFLALFHKELTAALPIPIFTSSLLSVHLAATLLMPGQKVGILTARKRSLTPRHLAGVNIDGRIPIAIEGMEAGKEFSEVFIGGKESLDREQCEGEMVAAAQSLLDGHPEVGPIVLECTNMPPYAPALRRATGRPVFDITTLLNTAAHSLMGK